MFNPGFYDNSRPDGIGGLEIVNDLQEEDQRRRFVPLKRTLLRGEVFGPLASLRLIQTYGYTKEQCDKVVEAVYRFPLPGDAAVTAVKVTFGEVKILAELKERQEAEIDYEEARRQGRQAVLATRESPNVFTLQVAGIQPDCDITVETSYVQLARPEGCGWSLRVPLTTAPRYVRSDEFTSRHGHGQPLLLLRDPGHRFSLALTFRETKIVESLTHGLKVTEDDNIVRVQLQDDEVMPDRDCVLSWKPRQNQENLALKVMLHDDEAKGELYFLAFVTPPKESVKQRKVPREIILLVDHSGSMQGAKWEAADWAVKKFLSELTEGDAFTSGLFHDTTQWFSKTLRKADTAVVEQAVRFLAEHKDSGGTELGVALEQGLGFKKAEGERARHLLIVTDAQVTDAARILRLASQEAKQVDRRRISVLCIDAAPNSFLASELAFRGGGVAKFLTSAPEEEDISTALDEVLADWGTPVLAGLRLKVKRQNAQAAGRETLGTDEPEWSTIDLGDLPAGRTIWVAGRVSKGIEPDLSFRVTTTSNKEVASCNLDLANEAMELRTLKALFGARRILGLEFLIRSGYNQQDLRDQLERLGYAPEEVLSGRGERPPKVYAENVWEEANDALRGLLVREALSYGLACSETAFVAQRLEAGKPVEGTVAVANALPAGWSEDFLSLYSDLGAGAGRPARTMAGISPQAFHRNMVYRTGPLDSATCLRGRASRESRSAATPEMDELEIPTFLRFRSFRGTRGATTAEPRRRTTTAVLFAGVPKFKKSEALLEALLFDSSRKKDAKKLPDSGVINRLEVRFPDGVPQKLSPELSLLLFIDDLSSPRAQVRLADVVRQGGRRPLNLLREPGQVVRLVLLDPDETWSKKALPIEVSLGWQSTGS